MQTKSSSSPRARNGAAPQNVTADWRPTPGIVDRMLAYRDWWNIPEGRRARPAGNRARPQAQPDREAKS